MKEHIWTVEEINGGHVGVDDFWVCSSCGASGGPVWNESELPLFPFLADGSGLQVGKDCDVAKTIIARHRGVKKL